MPFQPSANSSGLFVQKLIPPLLMQWREVEYPTARQDVGAPHETPASEPPFAPAGRGTGVVNHELPFHDSARGAPVLCPTAMQTADVQDTPDSEPLAAVEGVRVVVQPVPFQCSASGAPLPCPTAVQLFAAGQDTPDRLPAAGSDGLSVIFQLVPSKSSASDSCVPELLTEYPTVVHERADAQDTPVRTVLVAPEGVGVCWIDHVGEARAGAASALPAAAVISTAASAAPILRPLRRTLRRLSVALKG
jgi:hypothetical protein